MTTPETLIQCLIDDAQLSLEELSRASAVPPQWVVERVEAGLLAELEGPPANWRFEAVTVVRARCMARLERDFDAVPELAALVADLQDEIGRLRARLRRAGLD